MIYLRILTSFIKVGLFSIGGAYAAIPLIRDIVIENNWMNLELYTDLVAVAESTPGPLMLNIATYVGSNLAGFMGGFLATLITVVPSFIIMLVIVKYLRVYIQNKKVQYVFTIIRPTVCAIIFSVGIELFIKNLLFDFNINSFINFISIVTSNYADIIKNLIILLLIIIIKKVYKHIKHKKISSITMIFVSAVIGILVYL